MYARNQGEIHIKLSGWKGVMVVVLLVAGAGYLHYYRYYYNPDFDTFVSYLESNDPGAIGEALYHTRNLTLSKGHKLIPYILPLLSDDRPLPGAIEGKIIREIQSTPGAIGGMGAEMKGAFTLGYTAALALQSLVIMNVHRSRRVTTKAWDCIVNHVVNRIGPEADAFVITNGLVAVAHIHDKRLIPFWFTCLSMESETIRNLALTGLYFFVYDRNHGLFTWHPEADISPAMHAAIMRCKDDPSSLVRGQAGLVLDQLRAAGLNYD